VFEKINADKPLSCKSCNPVYLVKKNEIKIFVCFVISKSQKNNLFLLFNNLARHHQKIKKSAGGQLEIKETFNILINL
jgi:hypothetical protein